LYAVTTSPSTTTTYGTGSPIVAPITVESATTFQVTAVNDKGSSASASSSSLTSSNSYSSIATYTIGSGGAASITFSNIPQNYKHLQIRYSARMAGSGDQLRCQFNGDTSNVYNEREMTGNMSVVYAGSNINQSSIIFVGFMSGSAHTASSFGVGVVDILEYASVNRVKTTRTITGYNSNGSGLSAYLSGAWNSVAPIHSITLFPSSTGFVQNSHISLYGIA
jgi:hypothetical protein